MVIYTLRLNFGHKVDNYADVYFNVTMIHQRTPLGLCGVLFTYISLESVENEACTRKIEQVPMEYARGKPRSQIVPK